MTKQGLTDLERGKYYPGGDNDSSTVRVRPDQKIEVSTVDEITHVTNIDSIDLLNEVAHVTNLDLVDEIAHVTNVDLVDAVTEITNPIRHADFSVVPHETYNHFLRYLTNAGSPDQNVNGSLAVPVNFTAAFTTRSLIHSVDLIIVARNMTTVLDYGTIAGGLTNGIQIIRKVGAVETVFFTIKRIVEFGHPSMSGAFQTIKLSGNLTEEILVASIYLNDPIIMQPGDSLIVRIRDNITEAAAGIGYQRSSILLKEV